MLKNLPIMLCRTAQKYTNYAQKCCYYARIMLINMSVMPGRVMPHELLESAKNVVLNYMALFSLNKSRK